MDRDLGEEMQFSGRAILDNVGRLTHQSARPYSVTFVSANPSFRSANCPYLSVRPVRFGVAVDPPIRSVGPSINLCPSIPCHPPNCVRACILIQSIRQSIPLVPVSLLFEFTLSLSLISSIYLSTLSQSFALFRFALPLGSYTPRRFDLQNDLSRARSTRSPLPRVPRESRGFPEI